MKIKKLLVMMMCLVATTAQAQIKFCTSYADFKAGNWKPYSQLTPGKEPDSLRIQYDGTDFTLKTHDSEVNQIIKKDVLLMSIDGQLFINQHMLRDDDGNVLPVNHYLRALPYKGGDLCVVCYQVSLGDLLDLVNIGLDIALLATGHTTMGSIFLATDDEATKQALLGRYGQRVITSPNKATRDSAEGIQEALAEMVALSRTDKIYGSANSTFSQIAACLGDIPIEILTRHGLGESNLKVSV